MYTFAKQDETLIANPIKANSLTELFSIIIDGIIILAVPIMIFSIIWIGFQMILAQDKPEKMAEKRTLLAYVIIGILIILGAKGILLVVTNTVGSLRTLNDIEVIETII